MDCSELGNKSWKPKFPNQHPAATADLPGLCGSVAASFNFEGRLDPSFSYRTPCPRGDAGLEPSLASDSDLSDRLSTAVHVLSTEAITLSTLASLYATSTTARAAFSAAVSVILSAAAASSQPGKLVLSGVGKSGLIARKLAATFTSLSLPAVFLHPTEALHGDLGILVPNTDALLLVSFSGDTPELLELLPHVDAAMPVVLLTASAAAASPPKCLQRPPCKLLAARPGMVVLPTPVHETETVSFGVASPMTGTVAALAVGDALGLAAARERWRPAPTMVPGGPDVAEVFRNNHPGGIIGQGR